MPFFINPYWTAPGCDYPPYYCNTNVNPQCVTDFSDAWYACDNLTNFPLLDVSSGTNFRYTWAWCSNLTSFSPLNAGLGTDFTATWFQCSSLTSFPLVNVSSGTDFYRTWESCSGLSSFPLLDVSSGTTFLGAWKNCGGLTSFPLLDVSSGTDFNFTWENCTSLTSFPPLNTGSGTSFDYTWSNCHNLASFPFIDVSSGTSFEGTWQGCSGLTSFPLLDVSTGTFFFATWQYCSNLTSFPLLDVSSGTYFGQAWLSCHSLTSFPLLDVSLGTNFSYTWSGCDSLTSFPLLDVSSGTTFSHAWASCYSLASFPPLNTGSGTNFSNAWFACESLTSFPLLDTSSGTDFSSAWQYCEGLTSFPLLDVSLGEDFTLAWNACSGLSSFPSLNLSSGTTFSSAWNACSSLSSFPANMFDTCMATDFGSAWYNCGLNQTSVDNILVSLDTAGQLNGVVNLDGGTSSWPGAAGLAAKASLEAKGWTVYVNAETCDYPPYFCNTNVNPHCVTDLSYAWASCDGLTVFPLLDTSSATNLEGTWAGCTGLTSFPLLDTSAGISFYATWTICTGLTSFPLIDTSSGIYFQETWNTCTSLTSFPSLNLSSGTTFYGAWGACSSLSSFPANMFDTCTATDFQYAWENCALDQASVDNILVSLDTAGQFDGIVHINGGTSSPPGAAGLAAKASLESKGWTVYVNAWSPLSLPNFVGWWDASDASTLTISSGNVSQWNDKTGNGWDVSQSDPLLMPALATAAINGKNAIEWPSTPGDGFGNGGNSKRLFSSRSDVLAAAEIYTVVKYTDSSMTGTGLFNHNTNGNYPWMSAGGATSFYDAKFDQFYLNNGLINRVYNVFPEINSTCLVQAVVNPSVIETFPSLGLSVGMDRDYGYLHRGWRGYICEILVFSSPLSTTDKDTLANNLSYKWGFATASRFSATTWTSGATTFSAGSAISGEWTPDVLTKALWLDMSDATTISTSGSNILQINDKSGNSRHATQSDASKQPTYTIGGVNSLNCMTSNGSQFVALASSLSVQCFVIVTQFSDPTSGAYQFIVGDSSAYNFHGTGYINLLDPTYTAAAVSGGEGWINGTAVAPLSMTKQSAVSLYTFNTTANVQISQFSADRNIPGRGIIGNICEILAFTTNLTTTDRQKLEGYLAHKWGFAPSLPSGHPYKDFPPPL